MKASESEFIRNALNFTVYPKCVGACRKLKIKVVLFQIDIFFMVDEKMKVLSL